MNAGAILTGEVTRGLVVVLGGAAGAAVLRSLYRWWSGSNGSGYPYPPGPKGYPFINNLFDIPVNSRPWEGYAELSKTYGDMVFFRVFNTPILVLHSQKRAEDLLDKRSLIYSGRPHSVMMHDLLKFDNFFAVLDYGAWWRRHRKMFHEYFHVDATKRYHHVVERYPHRLLANLVDSGPAEQGFDDAARNAIAGLGIQLLYGVNVKSLSDPFISDALIVAEAFLQAGIPGRFMVETLPILKHIPSWFPGAGWRRWADYHREGVLRLLNNPFQYVWKAHKGTGANPCIATAMIDKFPENPVEQAEEATVARNILSMTHLGMVDTTHSMVMTFFQCMVIHPEVQRKAQRELDSVVGPNVLPTLAQLPELPYINAIMKETLRTVQVLPLALPHLVAEDNIYDGYFIPKGTLVFGNAWKMMHDPDVYEDPTSFKPERFLTPEGELIGEADEPIPTFGYGRRICPGRHLAVEILFSVISSTLAVYNLVPAKDKDGVGIPVEARFSGGAMMKPEAFNCVFEPRSPGARAVIQELKQTAA